MGTPQRVMFASVNTIGLSILILLFPLTSFAASAAAEPRPVYIKADCDEKISSAVLSFFSEGIRNSQKYRLAPTLTDDGRMDVVATINMSCTERNYIASVAIAYGRAKCFSATNCHLSIDGSSIRSTLCDSNAAAECGRELFKAFDDYISRPNPAPQKLE